MPPTKADSGNVSAPSASPKRVMTSTAPAAAPEESPNKKGSASSLRVVVCSSAPVIASPAPVNAANKARGTRSCTTIVSSMPESGAEPIPNAANACRHDSATLPNCRLQTINPHNVNIASGASTINRRVSEFIQPPARTAPAPAFPPHRYWPAPASAPHTAVSDNDGAVPQASTSSTDETRGNAAAPRRLTRSGNPAE
ncbi:hypothetical protein RF55_17356 [Lasius niger]|uniref:Uncharacterized protein n=1 Tax=Lasius niger TaxID=67767 RepID=A0A0J7K2K5_LASNI|nr:hypothetical protein RF55_17356 [Lasius niger]